MEENTGAYGLTLEQLQAINAKYTKKEFDYLEYNPDWVPGSIDVPEQELMDFLMEKGIRGGDIAVFRFPDYDNFSSDFIFNLGQSDGGTQTAKAKYTSLAAEGPYGRTVSFSVVILSTNDHYRSYEVLAVIDGVGMSFSYFYDSGYWSVTEYKVPTTFSWLSGSAESAMGGSVMLDDAVAPIQQSLKIATDIEGFPDVMPNTEESFLQNNSYDILQATKGEWDFEWMGTLESTTGFDYENAAVGTKVWVWCRGTDGLPLWHKFAESVESYRLMTAAGNELVIPCVPAEWEDRNEPWTIRGINWFIIKKQEDGNWKIQATLNPATILPRAINIPDEFTYAEWNTLWA